MEKAGPCSAPPAAPERTTEQLFFLEHGGQNLYSQSSVRPASALSALYPLLAPRGRRSSEGGLSDTTAAI